MRLLPHVFNQRDPIRANILLGNSPTATIGQYGCYVTSMAMVACYYGKDTDPEKLNQYLKDNNLFVEGNKIGGDDTLSKVYPDIKFEKDYFYPNDPPTPADLNLLHSLMDDPTIMVILEIDEGNHVHFVVCIGCNGVVTIADPWRGEPVEFSKVYGDPAVKILKFVVFSGIPAQQQETAQQIQDDLRKARDDNWNLYQDQLKAKAVLQEQLQAVQTERDRLQTEYNEVHATNSKISAENAELNGQVAKYLQDLSDYHAKDKTAVEKGLDAQDRLQEHKNAFQKLAEAVGIDGEFSSILHAVDAILAKFETKEPVTQTPVATVHQSVGGLRGIWNKIFL